MTTHRERSCTGKRAFACESDAVLYVTWIRSVGGDRLEPYRCCYCKDAWHVGHRLRWKRGA